jgi:hypothetical protein
MKSAFHTVFSGIRNTVWDTAFIPLGPSRYWVWFCDTGCCKPPGKAVQYGLLEAEEHHVKRQYSIKDCGLEPPFSSRGPFERLVTILTTNTGKILA